MRIETENSLLLIVDMQERLLPAMHEGEAIVRNAGILIGAAHELGVPVLASEQYPQGLGGTIDAIAGQVPPEDRLPKMEFSCQDNVLLRERILSSGRGQVVLAGVETHICVFQTVVGLKEAGFFPVVALDATGTRAPASRELAAQRLARLGVEIVSTEMVVFEWLRSASAPAFRAIARLVK